MVVQLRKNTTHASINSGILSEKGSDMGVRQETKKCSNCGHEMVPALMSGTFVCGNCDIYPAISMDLTRGEVEQYQREANAAIREYRKGRR